MDQNHYSETMRYRCLNEYFPHQTEDIYLMLCGVEQCTADKERQSRVRDGYHLHVVLSGEGIVEVKGSRRVLHSGQMFLIKPGEKVSYWPAPGQPWAYCWMSFNGAMAASFMREAGFMENVYVLDCQVEINRFYQLCDRALNHPQFSTAGALKRLGLLLEFIGLAIESHGKSTKQVKRRELHSPYRKSEYVRYAVDYIENNYANTSVADVADYLGIDRSYLSAIFKQIQGISPNEFLVRVRMKESSRLLRNPLMSIRDIARYVGYEDSLTFSKAFKRFFGVSPKNYREMPVEQRPDMNALLASRRQTGESEVP